MTVNAVALVWIACWPLQIPGGQMHVQGCQPVAVSVVENVMTCHLERRAMAANQANPFIGVCVQFRDLSGELPSTKGEQGG